MPDEQENVTDASSEETTSTEAESKDKAQTQPSDLENQLKELTEAVKSAKKEIQSAKDKARREVEQAQAQAKYHETYATTLGTGLGDEDPDKAEIARLRAEKVAREKATREEAAARNREKFDRDFRSSLSQIITSMGVDPTNEKIDWAEDETKDYLEKQRRTLDSATKLQKDNADSAMKKLEDRIKTLESKLGEEANSVDTGASGGATGSDADFLEKFSSGDVPITKANIERAEKLMNK